MLKTRYFSPKNKDLKTAELFALLYLFVSFLSNLGKYYEAKNYLYLAKWAILIFFALALFRISYTYIKSIPAAILFSIALFFFSVLLGSQLYISEHLNAITHISHGLTISLSLLTSAVCAEVYRKSSTLFDISRPVLRVASAAILGAFLFYLLNLDWGRGQDRFSGWTDNPNTLGLMISTGFAFLFSKFLTSSGINRLPTLLLMIISIFLIQLTGSRATALSVTSIVFISLAIHFRLRAISLIIIPFILILQYIDLIFAYVLYISKDSLFLRNETIFLGGREEVWPIAVEYIFKNPFFGNGFGSEEEVIQSSPLVSQHQGANFHNSFLSLLYSVGLLGSLPLFILIATAFWRSITARRQYKNAQSEYWIPSVIISCLTSGTFETIIFSPGSISFFIFWTSVFFYQRKT
jgi:O-antigen ligase